MSIGSTYSKSPILNLRGSKLLNDILITSFQIKNIVIQVRKKINPSLHFNAGTGKDPAVPPCLAKIAHSCVLSYADLFYDRSCRLAYSASAFPLALRSPFDNDSSAAITPPAALCKSTLRIYLLFFNGLLYFILLFSICQ